METPGTQCRGAYVLQQLDVYLVGDEIQGTVDVVGLDDGDAVVVEMWLVLEDSIPAKSTRA